MRDTRVNTTDLPIHPRTGLQAVGIVAGRPVWPIMGGSPDGDQDGQSGGQGSGQEPGQTDSGQGGNPPDDGQNGGQSGGQSSGQGSSSDGDGEDISALPEWAQKAIRDARADAGKARTTAKQKAADEAQQALAQKIGKALGLVKDDKDKADPDKLAEQVASAQDAQRQAQVELTVYRVAGKHEGNPDALLDSRTFLEKVKNLDPSEKDFAKSVESAIKDAVENNSRLRAKPAGPGRSGGEFNGGNQTGRKRPRDLGTAVANYYNRSR